MKGDFELKELEHGLARVEKFRSDQSRSAPSHALAVAHASGGRPGLDVEPVDEVSRVGAQAGATTMVVAAISKDIRGRCTLGRSTSHRGDVATVARMAAAPAAAPAAISAVTTAGTAPSAA